MSLRVKKPNGNRGLARGERVRLETRMTFSDVQEWMCEIPQLYPVCVQARVGAGVVDEYRRRKMAYKVVKDIFEQYSNYIEE